MISVQSSFRLLDVTPNERVHWGGGFCEHCNEFTGFVIGKYFFVMFKPLLTSQRGPCFRMLDALQSSKFLVRPALVSGTVSSSDLHFGILVSPDVLRMKFMRSGDGGWTDGLCFAGWSVVSVYRI